DMPLNKMAAQRRARDERAFQVYRTFAPQLFQIRSVQRFLEQIESELLGAMGADCQTATVDRDAVTDCDGGREFRRRQLQLRAAIGHSDPQHAADFFDESSEHAVLLAANG